MIAALLFSNYFASTSLPSLNVITVAVFSGLPSLKLNPSLDVTNPENVPFVNAATTSAYSRDPAASIACLTIYTASYPNAANETGTSPSYAAVYAATNFLTAACSEAPK